MLATDVRRPAVSKRRNFRAISAPPVSYVAAWICSKSIKATSRGMILLFRELQGVCALCRNEEECAQDLAHQFDDLQWDRWWVRCPNSAMLTIIGAVQNCGRAAQHLRMPPSAALSHLR